MKNERGSLLIAGLWAMSVFSVMAAGLTFSSSQEILIMKRDLEDFRGHLDFLSALNQVAARMEADPYPHEDSPEDSWFGNVELDKPFQGRLRVQVEDEESKLNLSYVPEALLSAFFKAFEDSVGPLKGSRKDYVKGISKLRSTGRIQSLEELLLMEDFEREDLNILRPYLTVYPETPLLNINTAKPLIVKSLLDFLSGDTGGKQIFLSRLEEACQAHQSTRAPSHQSHALSGACCTGAWCSNNGCAFTSQDLEPGRFAERLKLPRTPVMLMLVQEFLSQVTTDSETFHIVIRIDQTREAGGIFRYRPGQPRPEVFWWHEE